jgi:DNA-binding transcriptional LysR family regulator
VPAAPELRLSDLNTLLAVQRTGSISGAGRELRVTPSQVSKAIARLERHFGVRLLSRGARGVSPTAAGRQVLPRVANAVAELRATAAVGRGESPAVELTIAGPSYLVASILPSLVTLVPSVRLRGLELAPAHLRSYVAENVFDVALAPGGMDNRPAAWTVDMVGFCRSALFARTAFAKRLSPLPLTLDRVRSLPFVGPARVNGERFAFVSDDCPLAWEKRWIALEAQAVSTALEVVLRSDHVVFCPVLAAARHLASGDLVEVPVTGWDVQEPLHVLCNGDRVLSRVRQAIVKVAAEILQSQVVGPRADREETARADRTGDAPVLLSS